MRQLPARDPGHHPLRRIGRDRFELPPLIGLAPGRPFETPAPQVPALSFEVAITPKLETYATRLRLQFRGRTSENDMSAPANLVACG